MSSNSAITSKLAARLAARGINLKNKNLNIGEGAKEQENKDETKQEQVPEQDKTDPEYRQDPLTQNKSSASQPKPSIILSKFDNKFQDEFDQKLPNGWERHFSPVHDTWYYWDLLTDRVAWLPPDHEYYEAQLTRNENDFASLNKNLSGVTLPSTQKTGQNHSQNGIKTGYTPRPPPPKENGNSGPKDAPSKFSVHGSDSRKTIERTPQPAATPAYPSFKDQGYGQKIDPKSKRKMEEREEKFSLPHLNHKLAGKKRKSSNTGMQKGDRSQDYDPMDPSAYSDAPKGKWGRGMKSEKSNDIWSL